MLMLHNRLHSPAFSSGFPCVKAVSHLVLPHPCPPLCLHLKCHVVGRKPYCWVYFYFKVMTSILKLAPSSARWFQYAFFSPEENISITRYAYFILFLLPQASHTWSFTSYFTGRIEITDMHSLIFLKLSSPFDFFFSCPLVTIKKTPWGNGLGLFCPQHIAQCLAHSGPGTWWWMNESPSFPDLSVSIHCL